MSLPLSRQTMVKLRSQLTRQEGVRLSAYKDTEGVWTIGVGHTKGVLPDMQIDHQTASRLLDEDISEAFTDAQRLPSFWSVSDIRKAGLINIVFNLGYPEFRSWANTMAALAAKDWRAFHKHGADSKWVDQVGARAHEVLAQIRHDRWFHFTLG